MIPKLMTKTILLGILGVLIISGLSVNDAFAAGYIKFDGIDGEATSRGHEKWINLESLSHTLTKQDTKKSSVEVGIDISKIFDKSSPKLQEALIKGTATPKVTIDFTIDSEPSERVYLSYELKNVRVTSYQMSGGSESRPSENMSMNFEEIKVTYTEYDESGNKKGNVEYSWKVEKGEN
jgi:type VI secretion system Hcp family effector